MWVTGTSFRAFSAHTEVRKNKALLIVDNDYHDTVSAFLIGVDLVEANQLKVHRMDLIKSDHEDPFGGLSCSEDVESDTIHKTCDGLTKLNEPGSILTLGSLGDLRMTVAKQKGW